ncbi:MAG: mechanosensitive ion channel family protein [Campylobacterales bacterium]|nr:mechanosensitive ion channel family protein [Campylobacterales bacterium]
MKYFVLFLFLFYSSLSHASIEYPSFVSSQMNLIEKINDANQTQESIQKLLEEQNSLYEKHLGYMMSNQKEFLQNLKLYSDEIYAIQKIMDINKRAGNSYAYLRDEVGLKIYRLLRNQNLLIKDVLNSLDSDSLQEYKDKLHAHVDSYMKKLQDLDDKDYHSYLNIEDDSPIVEALQQNIRDYYKLYELNGDLVSYLYKFENKMYSLEKYSRYNLISFVIFVNDSLLVQKIDLYLYDYGLSVMKLIFMVTLSLLIYGFRKLLFYSVIKFVVNVSWLQRYASVILESLKVPIEALIVLININMILFVYNSFSTQESVSTLFNIFYTILITFIFYRALNSIAQVKLCDVQTSETKMKNDLINVGIKILNFLIFLIGTLVVLFFSGVNLTAVLSGLGIGGFAVAFAAKDTISNFFGTLSILGSNVFSQGDWIEVNSKEGVVVEIGLRVTTLRTFDNALIAIPNGTFATADVKNWNKRTLGRRIKMNVGVKYSSKSHDIQNALRQIREMLESHPGIATKDTMHEHRSAHMTKLVSKDDLEGVKKTLLVNLDEFASSSINIMIYCFSKSVDWGEWLDTKEDVMYKIMGILEKNNLEFAFPSLSLYTEDTKDKLL